MAGQLDSSPAVQLAGAQRVERRDHVGVELRARAGADLARRVLDAPRLLVGPLVDEHVEHVGDRARAAPTSGIASPREPVRVAAAVPALVVRAGDPLGHLEHLGAAVLEHARAEHRVGLDDLELLRLEPPGLEQDRVRDGDLAEVVQRRAPGGRARPRGRPAPGGAPSGRRARRRAGCAPASCRRGTRPRARAGRSASSRIASASRNALSAWLATIASSSPRRARSARCSSTQREPARARPRRAAGRPAARSCDRHDGRRRAEPERVQALAHGRRIGVAEARATTCGCAAAAWAATSVEPRARDRPTGCPRRSVAARRDSATSRFPPITRTRVPARSVVIHTARHDGGHDNGPASGQGRRGLPDRGADRPRRHGPGLPGRAPEPARAAPRSRSSRPSWPRRRASASASTARRGSPPRSSTRTSSRSTTRARRTACSTSRCSTSRAPTSPRCCARQGRLRPYRALDVCRQVAAALDAAHAPGPDPPRRQARQRADRGPHGVPDRLRPDQADRRLAHRS